MWSRVVEVMLGCWLLISPFVFRYPGHETKFWVNDLVCGAAVIVFSLLSYWKPAQHAHLLSLLLSGWLVAFAYREGFGTTSPASQNHLLSGLLLLMFAVIPNHSHHPAPGWDAELAARESSSPHGS